MCLQNHWQELWIRHLVVHVSLSGTRAGQPTAARNKLSELSIIIILCQNRIKKTYHDGFKLFRIIFQ